MGNIAFHGITVEMAKEFTRDYLGTLKVKNLKNVYRSVREIAVIMGIERSRACDFIIVACHNGFFYEHARNTLIKFPAVPLFKAHEER